MSAPRSARSRPEKHEGLPPQRRVLRTGEFARIERQGARAAGKLLVLIARVLGLSLQWRTHWRVWLFLGTVNTAIPFLCFAAAARSLPAGYMAVINATVPLLTVILAWAMFRIRPSASKRAGVVVGLLGVAVLARYGSIAMTAPVLLGIGLLFAAAAMYAYIALYVRQYPLGVDPLVMAAASQLGAAFVILPLGIHSLPTELPSLQVLACLLVLGIVCTGVAYLLYFRLLSDVGSEKAVTNTFLVPLFAQLWGALFLDEHLTAFGAIGFALVLLAVALVLEIRPWRKAQA